MNKKRKITLGLLSVSCVACMVGGLAACGELPEEKPEGNYTFENSVAKTDTDVTLDGNLSESFWNETEPYYSRWEVTPGYFVNVTVKTHFGEKGVYFAVDVDDNNVNFNAERKTTQNSGLEIMFAPEDCTNIEGEAFRYSITAGGQTGFHRYVNGYYATAWNYEKGNNPRSITVLKGGEIGTEECTGYRSEVFLPNAVFGGEAPQKIRTYFALICTFSSSTDSQRVWTDMNGLQIGSEWKNPQTWFLFEESGFVCNKVILNSSEHGTVTSDYGYTLPNMKSHITIKPDAGYRISAVTANGKSIIDKLEQQEDGSFTYAFIGNGQDVEVAAEFVKVPDISHTVSGEIFAAEFEDAPNAQALYEAIESIKISVVGLEYDVDYRLEGDKIVYSATAPEGSYTLRIRSVKGYNLYDEEIDLTSDRNDLNITIGELGWKGIWNITLNDASATSNSGYGTHISMYESDDLYTDTFMFGAKLDMQYDKGNVVTEIGFRFSNDWLLMVSLEYWGGMSVKIRYIDEQNVDQKNNVAYLDPNSEGAAFGDQLKENGGYLIVAVQGKEVKVYLYNGEGFDMAYSCSIDELDGLRLEKVGMRKNDDTLDRVFRVSDAVIRTNETEVQKFLASLNTKLTVDDSQANGLTDLTGTDGQYRYGDTVTISFKTASAAVVTVKHNGVVLTPQKEDWQNGKATYTYTFKANLYNELTITVLMPYTLNGTISAENFTDAPDAAALAKTVKEVVLISQTGEFKGTCALNGGQLTYTLEAPEGDYALLVIRQDGSWLAIGDLTLDGNATKNLTLSEKALEGKLSLAVNDASVSKNSGYGTHTNMYMGVAPLGTDTFVFGARVDFAFDRGNAAVEFGFRFQGKLFVVAIQHFDGYTIRLRCEEEGFKIDSTAKFTEGQIAAFKDNGGYIFIAFAGKTVTVYLSDGVQYTQVASVEIDLLGSAVHLTEIGVRTTDNMVAGRVLNVSGATVYTNETDIAKLVSEIFPAAAVNVTGADDVADLTGADGQYKYGETVTVSFSAPKENLISVTLNGKALAPQSKNENGSNFEYIYTFSACLKNELAVLVTAPASVSGTVTLRKLGQSVPADGATLTFTNTANEQDVHTVSVDNSEYTIALFGGTYRVTVSGTGFEGYKEATVTIDGDISNLPIVFDYQAILSVKNGDGNAIAGVSYDYWDFDPADGYHGSVTIPNPHWSNAQFRGSYTGDFVYGIRLNNIVDTNMSRQKLRTVFGDGKILEVNAYSQDGSWKIQLSSDTNVLPANRIVYTLTEDEAAKIANGGIKLQVARVDSKLCVLVDGKIVDVSTLPLGYESNGSNATATLIFGMRSCNPATEQTFRYMLSTDVDSISNELVKTYSVEDKTVNDSTTEINIEEGNYAWTGKLTSDTFIFGGDFGISSTEYSAEAILYFNGTDHNTPYVNDTNRSQCIRVQIQCFSGTYKVGFQILGCAGVSGWTQYTISDSEFDSYKTSGGKIVFTVEGTAVKLYLWNGTQFEVVCEKSGIDGMSAWRLTSVGIKKNDTDDSFTFTNGHIRTNDIDVGTLAQTFTQEHE